MRRINLGTPYEDFIDKMVEAGYYSTATEVIREALRKKMADMEDDRIAKIHSMVYEGQKQIDEGKYKKVDEALFKSILEKGKAKAKAGKKVIPHTMP